MGASELSARRPGAPTPGALAGTVALVTGASSGIGAAVQSQVESIEPLRPEDIADAIVQIITRDRRVAVNEVLIRAAGPSW
jgi:NADP-dependent 3-hydroxy acid dehydrogenase YdfG